MRYEKVLVSYPKCGRTWLWWAACHAIARERGLDPLKYKKPRTCKLWKNPLFADAGLPPASSTHERPEEAGEKADADLFLLLRDPRDVIVSSYYWRGDAEDFDRHIKREANRMGAWAEAWERSGRRFSGTLTYEELHEDLAGALRYFLAWLGAPVGEEALLYGCEEASFERMNRLDPNKVRRGEVGDWRYHMTGPQERAVWETLGKYDCSWWLRYRA